MEAGSASCGSVQRVRWVTPDGFKCLLLRLNNMRTFSKLISALFVFLALNAFAQSSGPMVGTNRVVRTNESMSLTFTNPANRFSGNGGGLTNVPGFLDIRDFGAATNATPQVNQAAIQAAIDAATNRTAVAVRVPNGTYTVESPLRYYSGTYILGDGSGGDASTESKLIFTNALVNAITCDPNRVFFTGLRFEDLELSGPGLGTSTKAGLYFGFGYTNPVTFAGNMVSVKRMRVSGFAYGAQVSNLISGTIENCDFRFNTHGYFLSKPDSWILINCKAGGAGTSNCVVALDNGLSLTIIGGVWPGGNNSFVASTNTKSLNIIGGNWEWISGQQNGFLMQGTDLHAQAIQHSFSVNKPLYRFVNAANVSTIVGWTFDVSVTYPLISIGVSGQALGSYTGFPILVTNTASATSYYLPTNRYVGSFVGDGSGLTNISAGSGISTNGGSGTNNIFTTPVLINPTLPQDSTLTINGGGNSVSIANDNIDKMVLSSGVTTLTLGDGLATVAGTVVADAFQGVGANLTTLNASSLSTGIVPSARLNGGSSNVVSVLDFGADPSGTADSSLAFTNAIIAIGSPATNALYIPPGTYLTEPWLTLPKFATVFGDGSPVTTVLLRTPAGGETLIQSTNIGTLIYGFTIDGNSNGSFQVSAPLAVTGMVHNATGLGGVHDMSFKSWNRALQVTGFDNEQSAFVKSAIYHNNWFTNFSRGVEFDDNNAAEYTVFEGNNMHGGYSAIENRSAGNVGIFGNVIVGMANYAYDHIKNTSSFKGNSMIKGNTFNHCSSGINFNIGGFRFVNNWMGLSGNINLVDCTNGVFYGNDYMGSGPAFSFAGNCKSNYVDGTFHTAAESFLNFTNNLQCSFGLGNYRANVGPSMRYPRIDTTDFAVATRYTNTVPTKVYSAWQLSAAVAGTATVTMYTEHYVPQAVTNKLSISAGPLASLITVEPLVMEVGAGGIFYFIDESSGSGASVVVSTGTCSTVRGL